MNQPPFITQACPKCRYGVHIVPQVGVGVCPQCHTQVTMAGSPAAAMPQMPTAAMGVNTSPPMPSAKDLMSNPLGAVAGFFGRFGAVGVVVGTVVVGALAVGFYYVKSNYLGSGKGTAGYAALGLDRAKPDGDKMLTSVEGIAKRWKKEAVFWSVNFRAVSVDGTVNPNEGAEVVYISPGRVASAAKKTRDDSIKKFSFGPTVVSFGKKWGAMEPWKGAEATPLPKCGVKQLASTLQKAGLPADKTFSVIYDPKWGYEWGVDSEHKAIAGKYSVEDCSKLGS